MQKIIFIYKKPYFWKKKLFETSDIEKPFSIFKMLQANYLYWNFTCLYFCQKWIHSFWNSNVWKINCFKIPRKSHNLFQSTLANEQREKLDWGIIKDPLLPPKNSVLFCPSLHKYKGGVSTFAVTTINCPSKSDLLANEIEETTKDLKSSHACLFVPLFFLEEPT